MYIDHELVMSDGQAITADAVSTNVLNVGADIGPGEPINVEVKVAEDFATCTSLTVDLQTATDAAFTTPVTLQSSTILLADLVAGKRFPFSTVPEGTLGFIRMNYVVNGADATAGKVFAALVSDRKEG